MVKVKICGITNLEDALASYIFGADAVGFVFYPASLRYISPLKARNISRILPKQISRVGVFVNEKAARVLKIAKVCNLEMLQFQGKETPEYCRKFKNYKVIKAFSVAKSEDLKDLSRYKTYAYLFDSFSKTKPGGTGKKFNWKILPQAVKIKRVMFLAGGLNSANVNQALKSVRPTWIDVSSALESRPGKKDHLKLRKFMQAVKIKF